MQTPRQGQGVHFVDTRGMWWGGEAGPRSGHGGNRSQRGDKGVGRERERVIRSGWPLIWPRSPDKRTSRIAAGKLFGYSTITHCRLSAFSAPLVCMPYPFFLSYETTKRRKLIPPNGCLGAFPMTPTFFFPHSDTPLPLLCLALNMDSEMHHGFDAWREEKKQLAQYTLPPPFRSFNSLLSSWI